MSHRQKNKNKSRHRIHADKSTGAAQLPRVKVIQPVVAAPAAEMPTPETAPVAVTPTPEAASVA